MPEGRRLVVLDLMGCGRSDSVRRPTRTASDTGSHTAPSVVDGGTGTTFDTQAALVVGLMDDLSIARAAIIGHGIGAALAQAITVRHPDRVSALCLMSSPAFAVWPRRMARLARMCTPFAGLIGAPILASFVHGSAIRGYADRDAGRRALDVSLRPYPARLGCDALVSQLGSMRDAAIARVGALLGGIAVPTAVIWGASDPFLAPSVGEQLRAAIPHATLDVIPGARHFVAEDAPIECAQLATALLAR